MQGVEFTGCYPRVIGEVTRLHAACYAEHWNFDLSFEAQVGRELAGFMVRTDPARDFFLAARGAGGLAGAVALEAPRKRARACAGSSWTRPRKAAAWGGSCSPGPRVATYMSPAPRGLTI